MSGRFGILGMLAAQSSAFRASVDIAVRHAELVAEAKARARARHGDDRDDVVIDGIAEDANLLAAVSGRPVLEVLEERLSTDRAYSEGS